MLTRTFYAHLEFKISQAFAKEKDLSLRHLWCDGVTNPENEVNFNIDYIKKYSKIELKSWFGKTGQEVYRLILKFGKISRDKIIIGEEIIDCIPDIENDWIFLDSENRLLEITLN